jgi:glycosyltransferase involved in cell wall biosynthesis
MHIDLQLATLGAPTDTPIALRERQEYDAVDVISVPSRLVEKSFYGKGFEPSRLARNPLGVDLSEFPYDPGPPPNASPLRAVFAGTFSRQKGADLMVSALASLHDITLTHVGSTGDVPPSPLPNVHHHAPVPQAELTRFYRDADVLLLPSRQDGFGMVMTQALASGCHVIASDHTGGPDLAELTENDRVTIIPAGDTDALVTALRTLSDRRDQLRTARLTAPTWRSDLSWRAYAERYDAMIRARLVAR